MGHGFNSKLVGGMPTPKKYEFVSWGYYSQVFMESHKIPWFQSPAISKLLEMTRG